MTPATSGISVKNQDIRMIGKLEVQATFPNQAPLSRQQAPPGRPSTSPVHAPDSDSGAPAAAATSAAAAPAAAAAAFRKEGKPIQAPKAIRHRTALLSSTDAPSSSASSIATILDVSFALQLSSATGRAPTAPTSTSRPVQQKQRSKAHLRSDS